MFDTPVIIRIVHLQVEFPEARIYEETLNVLLYEDTKPDMELIHATTLRVAGSHSDDDGESSEPQQPSGPLDKMTRFRRK